jgi:hypothetical protein
VEEHSASDEHGLTTQCPDWHASWVPHSESLWQAGMQEPLLPCSEQSHGPPGPHTIGTLGAASPIRAQSESMAQGFFGSKHAPHPLMTPPGLHSSRFEQSLRLVQSVLPASSTREASGAASAMGRGQVVAGQLPATQKPPPLQSVQYVGDPGAHPPPSPPIAASVPPASTLAGHSNPGHAGAQKPPPLHPVQYVLPAAQLAAELRSLPPPHAATRVPPIHTKEATP